MSETKGPRPGPLGLSAYVINLASDSERWQAVAASAARHAPGIALRRIDAVDGRSPGHSARDSADIASFRRNCGRDILPGEYGCYLSHLAALRAFLDDDVPYGLILEDDVGFEEGSEARIASILEAVPQFDVVKLVNHRTSMFVQFCETSEGDRVGRTLHGPQGSAAAYVVSRDGARRLLEALATMSLPWDVALERTWSHGASVFTTGADVLAFSGHRAVSNISASGYDRVKFPWYRRFGTALFRMSDYVRRVRHASKRPSQPARGETRASPPLPLWQEIVAGGLVLLLVSAVWVESDVYRFAGLALFAAALYRYFRKDFWNYDRPRIGWAGVLCIAWAAYVAIRFAGSYLFYPELGIGSSEGIYLLPVFYATTGYALFLFVRRPFVLATVFMALSAASLAFGTDYHPGGEARSVSLLHNNPIHASVAAGFISLCALPYGLHVARRAGLAAWTRVALLALAALTFLLSLLAVYGLWSKGVWLAMAAALPVLLMTVLATGGRAGRRIAAAAVILVLVAVLAGSRVLEQVAGPTVETALSLLQKLANGDGVGATLDALIADPQTGASERERMMLWSNALRVWGQNPLFGVGISWHDRWWDQPYQVSFNLMHNGYLEVAVRYGIVGLTFYAVLFAWAILTVWKASRAKPTCPTAFACYVATAVFFAVTLLSNSNIRLAIGESYMWFAMAFAFYCHSHLYQNHGEISAGWTGKP